MLYPKYELYCTGISYILKSNETNYDMSKKKIIIEDEDDSIPDVVFGAVEEKVKRKPENYVDNKKFFDFVDKCRAAGITAPIIPGLKPIATKKQLNLIPHRFSVDLPDDLIMAIVKAKDNEAIIQVGIEWCLEQSKELIQAGVPVLHYYSMGKSDNIKQIAKAVF